MRPFIIHPSICPSNAHAWVSLPSSWAASREIGGWPGPGGSSQPVPNYTTNKHVTPGVGIVGGRIKRRAGRGDQSVGVRRGAATVRPSVRQELGLGAAEALSEGGGKKVTEASQVDIWKTTVQAGQGYGRTVPATCHVPTSTALVRPQPVPLPTTSEREQHRARASPCPWDGGPQRDGPGQRRAGRRGSVGRMAARLNGLTVKTN